MLGHGSAITTAYNVTCLPKLGATNSGFPKFVSTVRLSEDDIDTEDISEEKKREKAEIKLLIPCHCVCVRERVGVNWRGEKVAEEKQREEREERVGWWKAFTWFSNLQGP